MGQQRHMLRLRRSYRRPRSYQADFGTVRAVLLDKSDNMAMQIITLQQRSPTLHCCGPGLNCNQVRRLGLVIQITAAEMRFL